MDDTLIQLRAELLAAADGKPEERAAIEKKIKEREILLQPMYHQAAVHFADLHDTPERMQEKGVIQVCIKKNQHLCLVLYVDLNLQHCIPFPRTLCHGREPGRHFTGDSVDASSRIVLNLKLKTFGQVWPMGK